MWRWEAIFFPSRSKGKSTAILLLLLCNLRLCYTVKFHPTSNFNYIQDFKYVTLNLQLHTLETEHRLKFSSRSCL